MVQSKHKAMNMTPIIEGSTLIHDWMGNERMVTQGWEDNWIGMVKKTDLKYHSDWRELMPVVEKIEQDNNYRVTIFRHCCDVSYVKKAADDIIEITGQVSKIQATWLAVIAFIKWYNSSQKS